MKDDSSVEIGEAVEHHANPVVYIFLNKSLAMSVGKAAAQASHAAMFANAESSSEMQSLWSTSPHKTIIILEARDEDHIRNIREYLMQRNFNSNIIIDEGVNEIDPHTITALSTQILDKDRKEVELTFSSFSLYKDFIKLSLEFNR